jgi:hypothetical protein
MPEPTKRKPKKKFCGWVRRPGEDWKRECTGLTEEAVRYGLSRDYGGWDGISTLVLPEDETPWNGQRAQERDDGTS